MRHLIGVAARVCAHCAHKPLRTGSAAAFLCGACLHGTVIGTALTAIHVLTWVLAE